jgi:hypothetical protein
MRISSTRQWLIALAAAAVVPAVYGGSQQFEQPNQRELAAQLLGSDIQERRKALDATRHLGGRMAPALRTALFTALEREALLHTTRYHATKRGEVLGDMDDPEFIGAVTRAVAVLQDPRAIPGLVAALGTGATVTNALAEFGEAAAPPVIGVVAAPDSTPDAIGHGLITLRFMVEGRSTRPLSPQTQAGIRRVAEQRLTGKQPFVTTLWRAIDLAVALRDTDLNAIVKAIAENPQETITRGFTDPSLVERTQKHAADRLAGVPALPSRQALSDVVK